MKRTENKKQIHNPSKKPLLIKISIILLTSFVLSLSAYGLYLQKKVETAATKSYESLNRIVPPNREDEVKPLEDNVSILFIGIDDSTLRDQGETESRSDALILATLNQKEKTVKLLSIPRDSYVYFPNEGYKDKINHAYGKGGPLSTIETIEYLLEVPIDYFVKMNFDAFIDVVDALGGIEADVPYVIKEKDQFDQNTVELTRGIQTLDGREALALARTRKRDNDIERGKRQQMIIEAIVQKAIKPTSLTKYDNVIDAIGNHVKTNMTYEIMTSFLTYFKDGIPKIDSIYLHGFDDTSTNTYYWRLDEEELEETKQIMQQHLELTTDFQTNVD